MDMKKEERALPDKRPNQCATSLGCKELLFLIATLDRFFCLVITIKLDDY